MLLRIGETTPPTQKAISASRPRWVTGGWSGAGERRSAGGAAGGGSLRGSAPGGTAGGPCRGARRGRARRYVALAAESGRVPVPEEAAVFTVRLPVRLAAAVREHARASGRTVSSVTGQALEEFLARAHGGRPSR